MRPCLKFPLGALALAQLSLATPLDDADFDFSAVALAAESISYENVVISSPETLTATITAAYEELDARTRTYSTSFSPFPTNNADYAAMTKSQHSQWCKTAKKTAPGYSRACVDGVWDSLYRRTDALDNELEARATYPTSFSPFPTNNADYAAMTKSQHSQWCKTAKKTSPGYSRACIDGVWDSLYRRTDAAEADEIDATATHPSSPANVQVGEHETTFAPISDEDLQKRGMPSWFSNVRCTDGVCKQNKVTKTVLPFKRADETATSEPTTFARVTRSRVVDDTAAEETPEKAEAEPKHEKRDFAKWFAGIRCTAGKCEQNKATKSVLLKRAEETAVAKGAKTRIVEEEVGDEVFGDEEQAVESERGTEERSLAALFSRIGNLFG